MAKAFVSSAGAASVGESHTASAIVARAVGSHTLRIDGYSHTKELGNGKFIASETFVIGGHGWRLDYYPDGGNSSYSAWISVYLRLLQANVDEVKAKLTISLLDHDGNKVPAYSKTCTMSFSGRQGGNTAWGFHDFIKRSELEASVYLKDDVFTIKCDVTVVAKEAFTKSIPVSEVRRGV